MTPEVIVFPDAEAVMVAGLTDRLGVPVSTKIPSPRPPETWVRVVAVPGGGRANLVMSAATLTFEAWAPDTVTAGDLARRAYAHVCSFAGTAVFGAWVYRVATVSAPGANPDPITGAPRYQFTTQIHLRGTAL